MNDRILERGMIALGAVQKGRHQGGEGGEDVHQLLFFDPSLLDQILHTPSPPLVEWEEDQSVGEGEGCYCLHIIG